jgi:hypothetical protein
MERPLDKRKLPKILITEDVLEKKELRGTKWDRVDRLGVRCFSLPILERDGRKIF